MKDQVKSDGNWKRLIILSDAPFPPYLRQTHSCPGCVGTYNNGSQHSDICGRYAEMGPEKQTDTLRIKFDERSDEESMD